MIRFRPGSAVDLAASHGVQDGAFSAGGAARMRSLEMTLSAIDDFAYIFDLKGRVLYANRALLELWNLSLEEIVGKTFFQLPYPEEMAVKLQGQIQEVIETKRRLVDEAWYTNPRGVGGCYEYIFSPVLGAEGVVEFVGGCTRDITDRKLAEDLLRESEERSAHIVESVTDGFMTLDREWRVTYINPRAEEIIAPLRKTKAALVGKSFWTEFPGTVGTIFESSYRRAVREHVTVAFDAFYPPLESWIDVRAYPSRDGLTIYFMDVTERKRADDAMRQAASEAAAAAESNAKFRAFFEQGTEYAGVLTPDGSVIEANRHCLEACGFTADDVIGKKFWDCGWWSQSPILADVIRGGTAQAAEGHFFRKETAYFIHDGSQRFVDLTLSPIKDDAGRVLFIAATGSDITEKRKLAEEREHLLEAERSARAEAERASSIKDDFLATLGHELRTPLNAILGWTYILKGVHETQEVAEGMETIERNARAQTKLIEDLLDMSSIISGKVRLDLAEINLASILLATMGTTKHAADVKGVLVEAVIDPLKVAVAGDASRLQQVFWNLMTNAIKFTPPGGRVKVLMERLDSRMEISVSDTGEGISPDFLPHVFDRFRQADASTTRRHGGLGLGLSIVKQLVELHGGQVGVRSPGRGLGATFFVSLPVAESANAPGAGTVSPDPARDGTASLPGERSPIYGVRVLVVDDEADARAMIKRVLEGCEAPVTAATSADEALAFLQSGDFDVLVSDIGMAGEDGYSLIRRVRALAPAQGGAIPAIALTAYARLEDREKAITAGFQRHLVKPVEPGELIAMIASISGERSTGR